jgi:hypothetical protein
MSHCTRSEVDVRAPSNPLRKPLFPFCFTSAAAASGQGRVSLCRARHERGGGEAGERGQQARGAQPRVHAVVSDVLYLLRVAWCTLHAVYRVCAAYATVTLLRSCTACGGGWRLGGCVQEATSDVKRGWGGGGGKQKARNSMGRKAIISVSVLGDLR